MKKRLCSITLAVAMILTSLLSIASLAADESATEEATYVIGDVNQDGEVTTLDALIALRAAIGIGLTELTSTQIEIADVNKDGTITAADALYILQIAVGRTDSDDTSSSTSSEDTSSSSSSEILWSEIF